MWFANARRRRSPTCPESLSCHEPTGYAIPRENLGTGVVSPERPKGYPARLLPVTNALSHVCHAQRGWVPCRTDLAELVCFNCPSASTVGLLSGRTHAYRPLSFQSLTPSATRGLYGHHRARLLGVTNLQGSMAAFYSGSPHELHRSNSSI